MPPFAILDKVFAFKCFLHSSNAQPYRENVRTNMISVRYRWFQIFAAPSELQDGRRLPPGTLFSTTLVGYYVPTFGANTFAKNFVFICNMIKELGN